MENRTFNPSSKPVVVEGSLESAQTVFVDGNAGASIGPMVSRVHFHEVVGINEAGGEKRKVVLNLTIPTAMLVEFCVSTLEIMTANSEPLKAAMDTQYSTMFKRLASKKE